VPTLVLSRPSGDAGWLVRTTFLVDEVVVARLRPGGRAQLTLAPGTYAMRATTPGGASLTSELTLREGESAHVVAEAGILPGALNPRRALQLRMSHYPYESGKA